MSWRPWSFCNESHFNTYEKSHRNKNYSYGFFFILCGQKGKALPVQTHLWFMSSVPLKCAVLLSSFEAAPWSHQRQDKSWKKAKPQKYTQREPEQWAVWLAYTYIQDVDCIYTGTKMEQKTLTGHLKLSGYTVHQHEIKNNRATLKSALFFD